MPSEIEDLVEFLGDSRLEVKASRIRWGQATPVAASILPFNLHTTPFPHACRSREPRLAS